MAVRAWAILDSGATRHFLTTAAPMTNMRPADKPIVAHLPNGERMHSTHTCMLDIPAFYAAAMSSFLALLLIFSSPW
jgi:hypothetical protein